MQVEIWSDVVCPWCYIAKRRFEAALSAFEHRDGVSVIWRSFELDPGAPDELGVPLVDHLATKYRVGREQAAAMMDRVRAVAEAEGIAMRLARARSGNTFNAHRLLHLAADHGVQQAVAERLFSAYFSEGQLVSDHGTLLRLAGEAGLDAEEAAAVLAGDRYADAVRADEAQARAFGARGVPFFVFGRALAVSGAQPPELLREALERAWDAVLAPQPVPRAADAADDACADGSCAM